MAELIRCITRRSYCLLLHVALLSRALRSLRPSDGLEELVNDESLGSISRSLTPPCPEIHREYPKMAKSQLMKKLGHQSYGHGAFMGAANELWNTASWNLILKTLMPDVHADVLAAVQSRKTSAQIIPMFENNPVMAAYGIMESKSALSPEAYDFISSFEWDGFFDPTLERDWRKAFLQGNEDERMSIMERMVQTMLIAHGGVAQTVKEAVMGMHQYANIRKLRKTQMGGVVVADWMDLFARALGLGDAEGCLAEKVLPRDKFSLKEAVDVFRKATGKAHFAVALDLKHSASNNDKKNYMPQMLDDCISKMNEHGLVVDAVAAFSFQKFPASASRQMGDTVDPVKKIKFFHHAGGLQEHIQQSDDLRHDYVMFNAAYLVSYDVWNKAGQPFIDPEEVKQSMRLDLDQLGSLAVYQKLLGLKIGLYVQEGDLCPDAYDVIASGVDAHSRIFELGFAWGGVAGRVPTDIAPVLRSGPWNVPLGAGSQKSSFVGEKRWKARHAKGTLLLAWLTASSNKQAVRDAITIRMPEKLGFLKGKLLSNYSDAEMAQAFQAGKDRPFGGCIRAELVTGEHAHSHKVFATGRIKFSLFLGGSKNALGVRGDSDCTVLSKNSWDVKKLPPAYNTRAGIWAMVHQETVNYDSISMGSIIPGS